MTAYIEGPDSGPNFLQPECRDDYVGNNNPVQVVNALGSLTNGELTIHEQ